MVEERVEQKAKPLFEKPIVLFEWDAPARRFNKKSPAWFAALVFASLFLFAVLVLFSQWSVAFLVLALAFAIFARFYFEPRGIRYQILSTVVRINKEDFDFSDLRTFWFSQHGGQNVLFFSTYLDFPPYLSLIVTPNIDQEKLEQQLLRFLPYHEEKQRDWIGSIEGVFEGLADQLPAPLVSFYEKVFNRGSSFIATRFPRRS